MPEVPAHLVPIDGLTNSKVNFVGLDVLTGKSGAVVRFDILDEDEHKIGTIGIPIRPQKEGTTDAVIAAGYRALCDMLRQWLYVADKMAGHYDDAGKKG